MTQVVTNFKPPKNPNRVRKSKRDEWPGNSKAHLALVRKLPSCISRQTPCDPHHLKIKSERGVGMKARDKWAVPLTRTEHDQVEIQGRTETSEEAWFKKHGIDPYELASALWKASPDFETMNNIIQAHLEAGRALIEGDQQ